MYTADSTYITAQKYAKLICSVRVMATFGEEGLFNWMGIRRRLSGVLMIPYFLISERVTQACSLCGNSHNCTFMMCVLFCLTLNLILTCLLKCKTNELGGKANEVQWPTPVTLYLKHLRPWEEWKQWQEDENEQDVWGIEKRLVFGNWKTLW